MVRPMKDIACGLQHGLHPEQSAEVAFPTIFGLAWIFQSLDELTMFVLAHDHFRSAMRRNVGRPMKT